MTLDEIVSDYIREYRDHAREEMRYFKSAEQSFSNPQSCAV